MTPELLKSYLQVCRDMNVMSARILVSGEAEFSFTLGPDLPAAPPLGDPEPGGWKTQVSDPTDPDPLGLGPLDAPIVFDDEEVQP